MSTRCSLIETRALSPFFAPEHPRKFPFVSFPQNIETPDLMIASLILVLPRGHGLINDPLGRRLIPEEPVELLGSGKLLFTKQSSTHEHHKSSDTARVVSRSNVGSLPARFSQDAMQTA